MELEKFGAFLRERRMELGLTQAELANMLNVTDKAVSRWERGKGYPEVTLLEPLAKALNLSLVELMQSRRIEGVLTKEEAEAAAAGVVEISQQPREKQQMKWFPAVMGAAVFAAVVILGIFLTGFLSEPAYMLTRLNPDFTVNDGFADWYAILDQGWTSMTHTAYDNGEITGVTRFWNGFAGEHTVTHTDARGGQIKLWGRTASVYSSNDGRYQTYFERWKQPQEGWLYQLVEPTGPDFRPLQGHYRTVSNRLTGYRLLVQPNIEGEAEVKKQVELEHNIDSIGQELICQRLLDADGNLLGYQRYGWNQYSQCTQVTTYDAQGNLTEQTVIAFQDRVGYGVTKSADGQVLETSKSWFTLRGKLKRRETYDPQGQLTGAEEYHFRFWEPFLSPAGIGILAAMWGIGGFLGVDVYLQLKKNREESIQKPTQESPLPPSKNTGTESHAVPDGSFDVWPYKVFCILFLIAFLPIFLLSLFAIELPSFITYRTVLWLSVSKAMGLALAGAVPAVLIRKKKQT